MNAIDGELFKSPEESLPEGFISEKRVPERRLRSRESNEMRFPPLSSDDRRRLFGLNVELPGKDDSSVSLAIG